MKMRYIYCEDTEDSPAYAHATQSQIAKQELMSYRRIIRAIARETDDLLEKRARITSSKSTSDFSPVHGSHSGYDQMDALCEMLDREAQVIDENIKSLQQEMAVINDAIKETEFPYRDILEARYLGTKHRLADCVEELGYDYNYLCALHGKALIAYAKKREIPEKERDF